MVNTVKLIYLKIIWKDNVEICIYHYTNTSWTYLPKAYGCTDISGADAWLGGADFRSEHHLLRINGNFYCDM